MIFEEEFIFQNYKDKCFINATTLKNEIAKHFKNVNVNELYIRIVNYQVKKYGETLRVRVKNY